MPTTHTPQYQQFRKLLIKARKEAGITQVEVAASIGYPQSYVSKYESGERRLDLIEFLEVAKAIKLDVHDFIDKLMM